jgi:cytochrome c oxidase cbb3-type subunit III
VALSAGATAKTKSIMKFRNYLETISGIGIFPLISLIIFFVFFISLLIYVLRIDKKTIDRMSNIPLNDGIVKKSISSVIIFLMISWSASAQAAEPQIRAITGWEIILICVLGVLLFVTVIVIKLLLDALYVFKQIRNPDGTKESKAFLSKHWWRNFRGLGVSLSDEKKILIEGHDYDGIQELDNRMPPWLQSLFLGTVIIAIVYSAYYFSGLGDLQIAELEKEVATAEIEKKEYMQKVGASMDENSVTQLKADADITQGKSIFQEKCTACHGPDGGGSVGPNLTDSYWLHGGTIKNIFKVIKYGVPEKGMISWEKQLSPTDIQKVASYVLSLKGSKPASPKDPQGELFQEEPVAEK